jgi:glycosyltransferase involved in cell wall biosynthesis
MVNHEFLYDWDINALNNGAIALCKTSYAQQLLEKINIRSHLIKFTTEDFYRQDMKKDMKLIVHLAGTSFMKGTRFMLNSWFNYGGDRLDVRLFIIRRAPYYDKTPEDLKYWDSLYPSKGVFEINGKQIVVERKNNVFLTRSYIDNDILQDLIMKAGIHLCPSLSEGWGHIVNQGRMAGSIVITTDAPPMNELIENDKNGLTIRVDRKSEPYTMPVLNRWNSNYYIYPIKNMRIYPIDASSMMSTVRYALSLSDEKRRKLCENARKSYVKDTSFFVQKIRELCQ